VFQEWLRIELAIVINEIPVGHQNAIAAKNQRVQIQEFHRHTLAPALS
jgi:hypothetical protein